MSVLECSDKYNNLKINFIKMFLYNFIQIYIHQKL
jgi:hypothetical protein